MYIADIPTYTKDKKLSHVSILLRHSYRENGKNKTRTIANLTHEDPEVVAMLRWVLQNKEKVKELRNFENDFLRRINSKSIASVYLIYELLKRTGIEKALGKSFEAKLAMYQIIARIIQRGSRLSAVRLAENYAICEVLGIKEKFTEDDLYKNLKWLTKNQSKIESNYFKLRYKDRCPDLFLYDVTSSYLEGTHNRLGRYGYNRDKKKGKLQIVAGLLCDDEGYPVSVKLFEGNTLDYKTVSEEINQLTDEFGCKKITLVGDRGMIKGKQIEELDKVGFFYITAITKSQIEKMLNEDTLAMSFFDVNLHEVKSENIRYIMKRNPVRAKEIQNNRESKKQAINTLCTKKNIYLSAHPRSKPETAIKEVNQKIKSLKIESWLKARIEGRELIIDFNEKKFQEESLLDGCYVIKSNLTDEISKETIHARYKDLAFVEQAFRCCKTEVLEFRPWFVQLEDSTRGHSLIVMLSYIIIKKLKEYWKEIDNTVNEGLDILSKLCLQEVTLQNKIIYYEIVEPSATEKKFLKAANVKLPKGVPFLNTKVRSRKKLKRKA